MRFGGRPEQGTTAVLTSLRTPFLAAWLFYLLAIIYVSLIPFELEWRPPAEAWQAFLNAPDMRSPFGSRLDWATNVLLALPGAVLLSAALGRGATLGRVLLRLGLALGISLFVAPVLEFIQVYVPQRVPARNDIAAQWLGSFLGVLTWGLFGEWTGGILGYRRSGEGRLEELLGAGYLFLYLVFSLFPFDFVFGSRGGSEAWLWLPWLAEQPCGLACVGLLALEVAAAVPLGWALGVYLRNRGWSAPGKVVGAALLFGLMVEAGQGFLAHETAQGLSVLTRAVGIMAGYGLVAAGLIPAAGWIRRHARTMGLSAMGLYGVFLAFLNGRFAGPLRNPEEIAGA
ncbi:MAG TPA: VanZ family protein, partial [Gammaproteobacteria bacterium]|nr:VanZ family protein [Gammaproteobacteria bacterium]